MPELDGVGLKLSREREAMWAEGKHHKHSSHIQ